MCFDEARKTHLWVLNLEMLLEIGIKLESVRTILGEELLGGERFTSEHWKRLRAACEKGMRNRRGKPGLYKELEKIIRICLFELSTRKEIIARHARENQGLPG